MQYGIYYAYWETEWGGNFVPYVEKCARLGFDVLEVACGAFDRENDAFFHELAAAARANGMALTGGYGPRKEHDLATADNAQAEQTFRFYADMFRKMELAGIDRLGGALYSYWPAHGTPQTDKAADTARSVRRMQRLADLASNHGITLGMEALNRFEGYLINTAQECIDYVRAVDRPNVKVMLDTFHMNIEEDSLTDAIRRSARGRKRQTHTPRLRGSSRQRGLDYLPVSGFQSVSYRFQPCGRLEKGCSGNRELL